MKTVVAWKALIVVALMAAVVVPVSAEEYREAKQARLDAACEAAREKKLIPLRAKLVEECVAAQELPSRADCQRYYAGYDGRTGGRAPLFYDLPECVAAFDYQQSVRSPD